MGKGVSILPTFVENLDIPLFFFKDFIYRQRGREGEKHQCVVAFRMPPTGELTWPATQACALIGNRTGNPLIRRSVVNPLSHTSQGYLFIF